MKSPALLLLLFFSSLLFAQDKSGADALVQEGIQLHDKGDYNGAIAKYNKALELDKDNLLALAEKAMTLLAQKKYEEVVLCCQNAINAHPTDDLLNHVYVTYGNALDALGKPDRSVSIYDEGLKKFPDAYMLHFNKGITLSGMDKNDEALTCFQNSVMLNPRHPGSHNAIARLQMIANRRVPSILAFCRFLVLEPEGKRARENLSNVNGVMKGGAKQTGKNNITITVDGSSLGDTTTDGKNKENSFRTTDLLLSFEAALDFDKKNKKKTERELFLRKLNTVCSSLQETQKDNSGFYWEYYVPYLLEMKEKKYLETFSYIAFASSGDPKVSKWIKSHKKDIDAFYNWSKEFRWKTK